MRPLTAWPACATHTGPSHTQRLCETLTGWLEWFINFFERCKQSGTHRHYQPLQPYLCKHVAKVASPAGVAQTAESLLSTFGPAPSLKQRTSEQDPKGRSRQRTSPCFGASEVASTQICEHKSAGSCGQCCFDLSAITRQTGANGEFWTFTGRLHAQAFALP